MDESPNHEPTLIERGMGIHLNHPITAQRGIRNSRPARWELRKPHPPSRGGPARERTNKSESTPDRLERAQVRLNARLHPLEMHRAQTYAKYVRMAPPWPAGILPMPAETNTSHTGRLCEKTLQEHPHSCKASGARPTGPLARPHRIAQQPEGKKVSSASVNICGILTDTVKNSLKVPLKNRGKTHFLSRKTKHKRT
jgi:hypothetical protein